jgi:hypothetical protein
VTPEVAAFLADSLVAHVATVSPKGRPFMTPLWFVVEGGALWITTGPNTWAARNVAAHPAVTLLFGGERAGRRDRFLRLRGEATRHHGFPAWQVLLRIAAKYYVAPAALLIELRHAAKWGLRARYYAQGGAGYLRVVPTAADFVPLP